MTRPSQTGTQGTPRSRKPEWAKHADRLYVTTDLAQAVRSSRTDPAAALVTGATAALRAASRRPQAEQYGPPPASLTPEAETDWVIATSGWNPDEVDWGTSEPAADLCPELTEILKLGYRAGKRGHGEKYFGYLAEFLRSSFDRGADARWTDED